MASCLLKVVRRVPLVLSIILAVYVLFFLSDDQTSVSPKLTSPRHFSEHKKNDKIHLAVVACKGETDKVMREALTLIKSAVIFTESHLHIYLFTNTFETDFQSELSKWPDYIRAKVNYEIKPVIYPLPLEQASKFMNWWGPCASFRLFLPQILQHVDSIIYVDSDVIFLSDIGELWNQFSLFNNDQVGALASRVGWTFNIPESNPNYIRKPDGQLTQVNSGVFLMNLTRMREERFMTDPRISKKLTSWKPTLLLPLYQKHMQNMFGDQNLINVIFHFNPNLLYLLPCKFNYQHKFCFDNQPARQCASAEKEGAAVVHGSANTFYNEYSPAFAAINTAFRKYDFEKDLDAYLLQPIIKNLQNPDVEQHAHCGGRTNIFIQYLQKTFENIN